MSNDKSNETDTNTAEAPPRVNEPRAPPPAPQVHRAPPPPTMARRNTTPAPALMELASVYPLHKIQRQLPNGFIPDAQMLYHTLGLCDQMMNTTDQFTRSTPAWIPIVSQLYTAVLWHVMILRVYVSTGHGAFFNTLLKEFSECLNINECLVPGPLVPFFQALAAVNGPHDWTGDIVPAMPVTSLLWDSDDFTPRQAYARSMPQPVIMLDQLCAFANTAPAVGSNSTYSTFRWYSNVFNTQHAAVPPSTLLGPQMCGNLRTSAGQHDAARRFWNHIFNASFTRVDANGEPLTDYVQLLGFVSQNRQFQIGWFQQVATTMQKYCQHFQGSVPLKAILPIGIGAVVTRGTPINETATANWLYPPAASLAPFLSSRPTPLRELPDSLRIEFSHSDHEIEELAEQYAMLTHTNMNWTEIPTQNDWVRLLFTDTYIGNYWTLIPLRRSPAVSFKNQILQIVATYYHRQLANYS